MGRRHLYDKTILFRALLEEYSYLKEEADKNGVPMAEIIRQCIALRKSQGQTQIQKR